MEHSRASIRHGDKIIEDVAVFFQISGRDCDGASITEVIRRALAAYETLLEVRDEGSRLVIEMPNGERERLRLL